MKTAICYYSCHHGNTLQVLRAMVWPDEADLIDVTNPAPAQLDGYDCVGFASGIYGFAFHKDVVAFAQRHLPHGKPVFFVCTYGASQGTGARAVEQIACERGCPVLGAFGCKGYDTFGPFKVLGGIAKGHPDARDLDNARLFYREMCQRFASATHSP